LVTEDSRREPCHLGRGGGQKGNVLIKLMWSGRFKTAMTDYNITPSQVGASIQNGLSKRDINIRVSGKNTADDIAWREATRPLSVVQRYIGDKYEEEIYSELDKYSSEWFKDFASPTKQKQRYDSILSDVLSSDREEEPVMLTQASLSGVIGEFELNGSADLLLLYPGGDCIHAAIFDIKSSWDEKPSHQIQTAVYTKLFDSIVSDLQIDVEISAGVIYRETDIDSIKREDLPKFDRISRETDVQRLLSKDGIFHTALNSNQESLPIPDIHSSSYGEFHAVSSLNSSGISILDIPVSDKDRLIQKHGLQTIESIASLYDTIENANPYSNTESGVNKPDKVADIRRDTEFSSKIYHVCQKAQSILGEINPNHAHANSNAWIPWIDGVGRPEFPDLDSLIRVYFNIQYDHVRDSIYSISFRVDCSLWDGETKKFRIACFGEKDEATILRKASTRLFRIVSEIRDGLHVKPKLHLYFYSQIEVDSLHESTIRHENSEHVDSLRQLLEYRESTEEKMVTIIESEISEKMAMKTVDRSVQSLYSFFYGAEEGKMEANDWMSDNLDLRNIFYQGLFDSRHPISFQNRSVLTDSDDSKSTDNMYELVPRSGSQIPVEYFWAIERQLDESWTDSKQTKRVIENYMWVDADKKDMRISGELYLELVDCFTHAIHHIERALSYKSTQIEKEEFSVPKHENSLVRACYDYLDMEFHSKKKDVFEVYRKPVEKRIADGDSVPITIKSVSTNGYSFTAQCELSYNDIGFGNSDRISGSCTISDMDRCVMTPLIEDNGKYRTSVSGTDIKNSTKVTVQNIDTDNLEITIKGFYSSDNSDGRYSFWHRPWSTDDSSREAYITEGAQFMIDPNAGNPISEKSLPVLENCNINTTYRDITDKRDNLQTDSCFDSKALKSYLHKFSSEMPVYPTETQENFITEENRYNILQGPPGTGKTSVALSHAIVARLHQYVDEDSPMTGFVGGVSNTATDEILHSVSDVIESIDSSLKNEIDLIRLVYDKPDEPQGNITYLSYYDDEDIRKIRQLLFNTTITGGNSQSIIFGTPTRLHGMVGRVIPDSDSANAYESSYDLFDMIAVDEASMMPLNQLFMCTAFLDSNSQVILAGDHRQLSPVQRHDWTEENRRRIREQLPYLSCLDYFRYLRGDISYDSAPSYNIDIPIYRLDETFRCHKDTAELLRQTTYQRDGIDFTSNISSTISIDGINTQPEKSILNESPITLVIHEESGSKQSNRFEAELISSCISCLEANVEDGADGIGITTPHNAQKGLIKTTCETNNVDTVERFQGQERDKMFISTTVSDRNQLRDEEEFILSPSRLNVALSRMKRKLVVIVPKTVFELIPSDVETYNDTLIWKILLSKADSPDWTGCYNGFGMSVYSISTE